MFKEEEFIINFLEGSAFVSDGKSIAVESMNLPLGIKSFKSPAHWLCRIIKYMPEEKNIFAEIIEYHHDHSAFLPFQEEESELFEGLSMIDFRGINTSKLLITAKGKKEIKPFKSKSNEKGDDELYLVSVYEDEIINRNTVSEPHLFIPHIDLPIHKTQRTIRCECQVAWKDLKFDFGAVCAKCKVNKIDSRIEVKIYNEHLRVEFDAIKNYFSKLFESKKIKINLTISLEDTRVIKVYAQSPEIDKINPAIIESVKFELIRDLPKKKFISPIDKSLFTMDEYFQAAIDTTLNAGTFYENENQLLGDLLNITSTRHYKNLRFLSEHHSHKIMKLRFVLKPFSFVFLMEGAKAYHIVWETLNTEEATYVWHTDKHIEELKRMLRHVEEIINTVKVQGKSAYIQSSDDQYHRVYHDYSNLVDGFIKWKGELESLLY